MYKISTILFAYFIALSSFSMELSVDDRYAQALNYRDGKIDGYTKDESRDRAEELFKALAIEDNAKAMHNYAMIQYDKMNYELAYEWLEKAGQNGLEISNRNAARMLNQAKVKKPLYLVVGTTRYKGKDGGPLVNAVFGHLQSDLSHEKTFAG